MLRLILLAFGFLLVLTSVSRADIRTKAAREAAEYLLRKFGKEFAEEGVETLSRKIETLAIKHGDEAIEAVRKIGPKTFRLVEEAGEHGAQSIKLLARCGDDAIWVVAKKNRMAIFLKYGDDAAGAMIKHGEIAEPLLQSAGRPAVGALSAISKQSGRRLAMMAQDEDETVAKIIRTDGLLDVVGKYGDRAMDFIWKHKGSLTVAACLTAFVRDPEPFLDGTKEITRIVAENAVLPLASVPGQVAGEAARSINWTLIAALMSVIMGAIVGLKLWLRARLSTVETSTKHVSPL